MTKKKLTITETEPVLLFGSNDIHLKKVEAAFPNTKITARGNQLVLQGAPNDVASVEKVIRELISVLIHNKSLTENDVETVLTIKKNGNGYAKKDKNGDDVILHTPSGNTIKAKTPNQKKLVDMSQNKDLIFAVGPAGTGKTYTAVALAVVALKSKRVRRIVLCRPAVEAGERLGFLPGDLKDKVDPYLRPLYDALEDMVSHDKLSTYLEQNIVEIVPLAYMRGRTLSSAFVILDEAQNATKQQMKMFLTRIGYKSCCIITGDMTQTDLPSVNHSGLKHAQDILQDVNGIGFVQFDRTDVLRHRLVKDIIDAYEKAEE
ncbi:MAG: PhoH family protein [Rhodothermaceae bacterium]|nr:PhoH family protein [Rhodothermaceae bacterium]